MVTAQLLFHVHWTIKNRNLSLTAASSSYSIGLWVSLYFIEKLTLFTPDNDLIFESDYLEDILNLEKAVFDSLGKNIKGLNGIGKG